MGIIKKEIPELAKYFSDFKKGEYSDRAYMWGVLGALKKDAWKELISKTRHAWSTGDEDHKDDLIEIHPDLLEKLMKTYTMVKSNTAFLSNK